MKLVKLIANLGYGSRKDVTAMFRAGMITDADGEVLYACLLYTSPSPRDS